MKKFSILFLILFGLLSCASWQSNMRVITCEEPPMSIWKQMKKDIFLLTEVNDWANYHTTKVSLADKESGYIDSERLGACLKTSQLKISLLKELGIRSEEIICYARSKYTWDHSGVKVYLGGEEIFMDNGVIMEIPWEYEEVKKACYSFILP